MGISLGLVVEGEEWVLGSCCFGKWCAPRKCVCPHWNLQVWIFLRATCPHQYQRLKPSIAVVHGSSLGSGSAILLFTLSLGRIGFWQEGANSVWGGEWCQGKWGAPWKVGLALKYLIDLTGGALNSGCAQNFLIERMGRALKSGAHHLLAHTILWK
jgi:hypothetical protein